jgi:uncharacterized RDD family membrane protein YckC
MYCPKCGTANEDNASYCLKCGTDLKTSPPATGTSPIPLGPPGVTFYAGFWKRFAAFIIDDLIITAASFVLIFVSLGAFYPIAIIGGWLYFALMESSSNQATLGKMALGIKVTDMDGNRISFGKATGRYFGRILSGLILCIGYIMIAFTDKKQGLHDILANCLVVNK